MCYVFLTPKIKKVNPLIQRKIKLDKTRFKSLIVLSIFTKLNRAMIVFYKFCNNKYKVDKNETLTMLDNGKQTKNKMI